MNRPASLGKRLLACALSASMAYAGPLRAELTDIATYPITQPASSSLSPNLLLILDDSGSMSRQFTPDYVSTYTVPGDTVVTKNCFDSYDSSNDIVSSPDECWAGDPPAMSPDFNVQYYSPEIRYFPAVDYDGSQRDSMTAANTNDWTEVKTDNVSPASMDRVRKDLHSGGGGPGSASGNWGLSNSPVIDTMNLKTNWPERVWCTDKGDPAVNPAQCKANTAGYTYPGFTYGYGLDLSNNRKYRLGPPYYFRIVPTEFCTDARLDTCVAATEPTVVGGVSYSVPAPVRFCTDTTLATCHAKRSLSSPNRRIPKFVGNVVGSSPATPAVSATGTITIQNPQNDGAQGNITSIRVTKPDGTFTDIINGSNPTLNAGSSASTWATNTASRIGSTCNSTAPSGSGRISSPDYRATSSSNVVTVTACDPGEDTNGATFTITTNVTGTTPAKIRIRFTNVPKDNTPATSPYPGQVTSLVIDGVQFATSTITCTNANCNSSTPGTRNNEMAEHVRTGVTLPGGWSITRSSNIVTITAPSSTGSEKNGLPVSVAVANGVVRDSVDDSGNVIGTNPWVLRSGVTTGDVQYTTQAFSGGANTIVAGSPSRQNVGNFVRTNIVPFQADGVTPSTYNKYAARTDCVAQSGVCTYAEEMTNFANWFAYYRTRMQTAKTAIGRAISLAALPPNWRLGFMTINFDTDDYRAVAPFTGGPGNQKDIWYQRLYGADASGGTPLRKALSRAGRYFANRNPDSMGATPINSACQPNFAILTSDGYWNDSSSDAEQIDGSDVGNQDSDGSSNTLADVAYYYYNTDLLPDPPLYTGYPVFKNQVPPSGIDTAPHQHMTTFTVGMGVSGSLLFHPNYLEPGNSIDYDLIAGVPGTPGTNAWPAPVEDTETTIDDMWHAAVNGKGRFFSAQNPVALALGINEVLSSIAQRVGAGAAAATSNLQPVAGDNFAFTAQYATVEWSGDLKARTISLTDGVISNRELWSASAQLDQRGHLDRAIYTFDAADTDPSAEITVNGIDRTQNGNKLRSFCRHYNASDAKCDDGGLVTVQEADDYFNPLGGASGALTQAGGWPDGDARRDAATRGSLIRFLRGETTNEMVLGGTSSTDLYRDRAHLLGDIVNAQPAYVKASPFNYGAATDPFYIDFRSSTDGSSGTRRGTVYVAANDGMLHAFETDPDNSPYYQSTGVSTLDNTSDDNFVGTLNTDPITGEGAERWAYVPTLVFPTLKRLAEQNYSANHLFYVDGSPQVGDVCFGHTLSTPCSSVNNWKTILVGGLNNGGRGYYALDITNPLAPKGLWELKGGSGAACITNDSDVDGTQTEDCNIGYTFGNPIIAKRPEDGKWVVLVTSGHNNVSPGDGKGYLYVLDAQTGKILRRMGTGLGCDTGTSPCTTEPDPSGLARINAWVPSALTDNTALAVYGGDLKGNLWRFQLDDSTTPSIPRYSVTKLATVYDPSGDPQPITVRPELAEISTKRVIAFGTGRFLGSDDKTDNQRQSIYAIKDAMAGAGDADPSDDTPQTDMTRIAGTPTTIAGFVRQALTEDSSSTRTVSTINPVSFSSNSGWFIDLTDGGSGDEAAERVNVDPILQLGTLVVPSNVPSSETCVAGGSGWVNFLDIKTGGTVPTGVSGTPASVKIAGSLIVGINVVKIGDQIKTIVTTADNQQLTQETPVTPGGVEGRRVTWRELFVE